MRQPLPSAGKKVWATPGASAICKAPMSELTPLMRQYWDLKAKVQEQAGDALLFFRMGDFYELFGDDAVVASRILGITLTSRDKSKPDPMPMAGVPHHSAQGYIQKLLKAGKKVAIGEQVEDPETAKGIVRRDITRIFTPAVQFESLETDAAFLATLVPIPGAAPSWVFVAFDPATGESFLTPPLDAQELSTQCGTLNVRHWILAGMTGLPEGLAGPESQTLVEALPPHYLNHEPALALVKKAFGWSSLESHFPHEAAAYGLALLIFYTQRLQKLDTLAHLKPPRTFRRDTSLQLGPRTAQHLDLLPAADGTPNLYDWMNRTKTALGARQLKRWLLEPLCDEKAIAERQVGVQSLGRDGAGLKRLQTQLAEVYDLERILGRVATGLANPRDTLALGRSLRTLPGLAAELKPFSAPLIQAQAASLRTAFEALGPLTDRILRTQRDEAPLVVRDGGVFNLGTTPELDELILLTQEGEKRLIEMEAREREATGISSLKIRYNRVFGYYIEVTKANLKQVPAHYQRKQSTVNAERFFHDELKDFEDKIINASTRQKALETKLFEDLVAEIRALTPHIMNAATGLGQLDALGSLAQLGLEPGWCFPKIDATLALEIRDGRHPLVDASQPGKFVPNDLELSPDTRQTLLITGPNMGGKSTIMRQIALIVILGQMGAPVPARSARWGKFHSLYTRIGAHDAIARGQSTFMVEMTELAHILHHADDRSLIVLDEIGRGTSTFDGMSVAWATLSWICREIEARTLFATHYHELTHLSEELPRLANAHMAVEGGAQASALRFLYKLRPGAANESFGIQVAKLAGIPEPIIHHAWDVLKKLETQSRSGAGQMEDPSQLSLFNLRAPDTVAAAPAPVREPDPRAEAHARLAQELYDSNLNEFTPLQALNFLAQLRAKLPDTALAPPKASS
ncbi:MAG: DNA mismatch repair protein MutS [Bacteriovoracia bacterium]